MELEQIYENECLFINYDKRTPELEKACKYHEEKASKMGLNYKDLEKWLKKIKKLGYTFDYGLDGEPYNLMTIEKYNDLLETEKGFGILYSDIDENYFNCSNHKESELF